MEQSRTLSVGFLGIGAIAAAMIDALMSGPNASVINVVVSPRSAVRSAELASRHPRVRVAPDNQSVVDAADIVVLSVLPDQMPALCASLVFREEHIIASLAAGWPPSILAEHVEPASTICQMIPLPMIALHTGPVVLCPPVPELEHLLEGCGEIVGRRAGAGPHCVELCVSDDVDIPRLREFGDRLVCRGRPRSDTAKEYVAALFARSGRRNDAHEPTLDWLECPRSMRRPEDSTSTFDCR